MCQKRSNVTIAKRPAAHANEEKKRQNKQRIKTLYHRYVQCIQRPFFHLSAFRTTEQNIYSFHCFDEPLVLDFIKN